MCTTWLLILSLKRLIVLHRKYRLSSLQKVFFLPTRCQPTYHCFSKVVHICLSLSFPEKSFCILLIFIQNLGIGLQETLLQTLKDGYLSGMLMGHIQNNYDIDNRWDGCCSKEQISNQCIFFVICVLSELLSKKSKFAVSMLFLGCTVTQLKYKSKTIQWISSRNYHVKGDK